MGYLTLDDNSLRSSSYSFCKILQFCSRPIFAMAIFLIQNHCESLPFLSKTNSSLIKIHAHLKQRKFVNCMKFEPHKKNRFHRSFLCCFDVVTAGRWIGGKRICFKENKHCIKRSIADIFIKNLKYIISGLFFSVRENEKDATVERCLENHWKCWMLTVIV